MARRRRQLGRLDGVYQRLREVAERDLVLFDGPPLATDPVLRDLCRDDPGNPAGRWLRKIDVGEPIEVTGADLVAVGDDTHVETSASYIVAADDSVVRQAL